MDCIIVRYAELALKGNNRIDFERRLVRNIKDCLRKNGYVFSKITRARNRIIIHSGALCPSLRNVFGICSYSHATKIAATLDEIRRLVIEKAARFDSSTKFRISTQRLDKIFPMDSLELDRELGRIVVEKTKAKVSLKDFDVELGVEIYGPDAYVFEDRIDGFGGLPLGSGGCALGLMENDKSILACWLLMKRGVLVLPVSFGHFDISLLEKYAYGFELSLLVVKEFKEILSLMELRHAKALVIGTTLEDFSIPSNEIFTLMPLIGFGKRDAEQLRSGIE